MAVATITILVLFFTQGSMGHALRQSPIVRIAGGHTVDIEDAPYMAALLGLNDFTNERELWCAGSIIHPKFILTSASCSNLHPIVRVGSTQYNEGGELHEVEKYIVHESYSYDSRTNNVALLKLSEPITFGPTVARIKLVNASAIPIGLTAKVAGWGYIKGTYEASWNLQQVSVTVSSAYQCNKYFRARDIVLSDKQICVADNGACFDDRGAPLTYRGNQIGIVSYGNSCWGAPTVYEHVTPYLQWIKEKVSQNL